MNLIRIALVPKVPVEAAAFRQALVDLKVSVYDLTVQDSIDGVLLGSATDLAAPNVPLERVPASPPTQPHPKLNVNIIQHYFLNPQPTSAPYTLQSVATAVIVVNTPPGHREYPSPTSFDLRVKLERNNVEIIDNDDIGTVKIFYNVSVQTNVAELSIDQVSYFLPAADYSAIVSMPAAAITGVDPTTVAYAVDLVLAKDHPDADGSGPYDLANRARPLTAAQSSQIAAEIVWNREVYPIPQPPRTLEDMYTIPAGQSLDDTADQKRKQYEGLKSGYMATHNAEALRLAGYVFAACSAVFCERFSALATAAAITIPVKNNPTTTSTTTAPTYQSTSVVLTGVNGGGLVSPFIVPAAYFYVLGVTLPFQIGAEQRYASALTSNEDRFRSDFQAALDEKLLSSTERPLTSSSADDINLDQAARRLYALGTGHSAGTSIPSVVLEFPITRLIGQSIDPASDWLGYTGTTADIVSGFWTATISNNAEAYLDLLLKIIIKPNSDVDKATELINKIRSELGVASFEDLAAVNDVKWRGFFDDHPGLLPKFTEPGNTKQRTDAFLRRLKNFFALIIVTPADNGSGPLGGLPALGVPTDDIFKSFISQYENASGTTFDLGTPLDFNALETALDVIFNPSTEAADDAREWLKNAIQILSFLFSITGVASVTPERRFSLMEALYARGLTTIESISALTPEQFQENLVGTVAYDLARSIYTLAMGESSGGEDGYNPATGTFIPVNPDGLLTNCVPPRNLSPLGPVEYLKEILRIPIAIYEEEASTEGEESTAVSSTTLGALVAQRRGDVGDLSANAANLEVQLPMMDLVLESLEALGSDLSVVKGAVYNTNGETMAGFPPGGSHRQHEPSTMFAALPEHSSPATPVEKPAIYEALKACFTAPDFPYNQPLDICRSNLCGSLHSSRIEVMRHFRRDITELSIDPEHEPADFQRHLWRLPLHLPLALEYLCITYEEYAAIYSGSKTVDATFVHELYGILPRRENQESGDDVDILQVSEFRSRVGLTYCQFLELWKSQFIPFTREREPSRELINGPERAAGADGPEEPTSEDDLNKFPDCEPCCPAKLRINFGDVNQLIVVYKLAVFTRLWRRLHERCGLRISFAQLADICNVLGLFTPQGTVDGEFIRKLAALVMLVECFHLPLERAHQPRHASNANAASDEVGAKRTQILGLWVGPSVSPAEWSWAVHILLDKIEVYARHRFHCPPRGPDFNKIWVANLEPLSRLAGFSANGADSWYAQPGNTLRFAEVLSKIYASEFTVGEVLLLFTVDGHLLGDDPFPMQDQIEAAEDPLELPEDLRHYNLWALREKLLCVDVEKHQTQRWSWQEIATFLRDFTGDADGLYALGSHFFPSLVGYNVPQSQRRFAVDLQISDVYAQLWNALPCSPFHYEEVFIPGNKVSHGQLWTTIPLRDEDVIAMLGSIRQLDSEEQTAVRDLYFAPRAALAPFAFIFSNFDRAAEVLIQDCDERKRYQFFKHEFALFHRRCKVIVEHLAEHVAAAMCRKRSHHDHRHCGELGVARLVLRNLVAAENPPKSGSTAWELDSGVPPARDEYTWLSGSAFAALLGLVGTGLLSELKINTWTHGDKSTATIWRDVTGDLGVFGRERNKANAPLPTILPSLGLVLTAEQEQFAISRNGFAMRDMDGVYLGGAQPFELSWQGALLIDKPGDYHFKVGIDEYRCGHRGERHEEHKRHDDIDRHDDHDHEDQHDRTRCDRCTRHDEDSKQGHGNCCDSCRKDDKECGEAHDRHDQRKDCDRCGKGNDHERHDSPDQDRKHACHHEHHEQCDRCGKHERHVGHDHHDRQDCCNHKSHDQHKSRGCDDKRRRDDNHEICGGCDHGKSKGQGSGDGHDHHDHHDPGHEGWNRRHRWVVTLRRGQKTWTLLNKSWHERDGGFKPDEAPDMVSLPLWLRRGTYQIAVHYELLEPTFASESHNLCRLRTGLDLEYAGPDSSDCLVTVPANRLFRVRKTGPLNAGLETSGNARNYLELRYTSSLEDIRHTYQRAFKALLFARRFSLSADDSRCDGRSELGNMLSNGERFQGSSYFRLDGETAEVASHHAFFDFNFLPVTANNIDYVSTEPYTLDPRNMPSSKRQAALFDWWERTYDYTRMRAAIHETRKRPVWWMFYEAAVQTPALPTQLVRHLAIDVSKAATVLNYFDTTLPQAVYAVAATDLEDERWATRAWRAGQWIEELLHGLFAGLKIEETKAAPWLWASDSPGIVLPGATESGNHNLTHFIQESCFANGRPARYADVQKVNDKLRLRAREAIITYLCQMERLDISFFDPSGPRYARGPRDLTTLLLQDVEVGLCEKASRIEEASSCVQRLVHRIRLGLEPLVVNTSDFSQLWDLQFATFEVWEIKKRRELYEENWVHWEELKKAQKTESFRFLEKELGRSALTVPVPGSVVWWSENTPPSRGIVSIQSAESASLETFTTFKELEGLNLLGTPDNDGRLSRLAPLKRAALVGRPQRSSTAEAINKTVVRSIALPQGQQIELPLWIQAAIRMGTRFVRVAAASIPPSSALTSFHGRQFVPDLYEPPIGIHEPFVDEYYFWLAESRRFDGGRVFPQAADIGSVPTDPTSDWDREEKLPGLLDWPKDGLVHLYWTRVHLGKFNPPRRSHEGLDVAPDAIGSLQLGFSGRRVDSLFFTVSEAIIPPGHADTTALGFRYDIAPDSAIVVPEVKAPPAANLSRFPKPLPAYPFFLYHTPGAPLFPLSKYSVALAVAGTLRGHCWFEDSLKWLKAAFDPLHGNNKWAQCAPILSSAKTTTTTGTTPAASDGELSFVKSRAEEVVRNSARDAACCPNTPRSAHVTRARAVMLQYLETLLQWGDGIMERRHPEAFQQALIHYDLVEAVLGPLPPTIHAHDVKGLGEGMKVKHFKASPAPLNPRLLAVWERVADRRSLIHHCINGYRLQNGRSNIDMRYWSASNGLKLTDWHATMQPCTEGRPYRFAYLLPKALEMAGEVRTLGSALLSAYEKGDAEKLAVLRSAQESQLQDLALEIRKNTVRESDWQIQSLQKAMESAQTRLRYIEERIANGLNGNETAYKVITGVSMATRSAGDIVEGIGQGMTVVPDMWIGVAGFGGTPLNYNQLPLGNKLAANFATAARILNSVATVASTQASLSLTKAGWDRREDDWRHQVDVINIEIDQIKRQLLQAARRKDISLRELNNQVQQIDHSMEVENFMRDKFTPHALYLFLQQETAALYRQAYDLALQSALELQEAFRFEREGYAMEAGRNFIPHHGWNSLPEGLMAGEGLSIALRRIERAFMKTDMREYELTKHFSLALHFPVAFLQLKATGRCEIDIPEWMFDMDYPGHYLRRIKNVMLMIPCIVGPYSGVHCRMTMLSSRTRIDPRLREASRRCCSDERKHCGDCEAEAHTSSYVEHADDARLTHRYAATQAVVTSTGQNDAGLFEVNFRDERYLPFEYNGAVSRWRIELPAENNQFDIESLSDFIIRLSYTAREGGELLRRAANAAAKCYLPGNGVRYFDVRHEFPDVWGLFRGERQRDRGYGGGGHSYERAGGIKSSPETVDFPLRFKRSMFPYLCGRPQVKISAIEVFIELACAENGQHLSVEYVRPHKLHRSKHEGDCGCRDRLVAFECVVTTGLCGMYQGCLQLEGKHKQEQEHDYEHKSEHGHGQECTDCEKYSLGELGAGNGYTELGQLRFPRRLTNELCVKGVYLLARYEVCKGDGCGREEKVCCCCTRYVKNF